MTRTQSIAAAIGGIIALKLMGFIVLSWVWILAPLWVPATISLSLAIVGIAALFGSRTR